MDELLDAASMDELLDAASLPHLSGVLVSVSTEECAARLATDGRPAFLQFLKEKGVTKLTERQLLANLVARRMARRSAATKEKMTMPLTLADLEQIRNDSFADDVEIDYERMREWSAGRAHRFFECGGRNPRLAIFCRPSYEHAAPEWGPSSQERGIGGSESAVIALSRALAAQGWAVEVYASPPHEEIGIDSHGVSWLPHWAYGKPQGSAPASSGTRGGGKGDDEATPHSDAAAAAAAPPLPPVDVFVAWRFAEVLQRVGRDARRRYLWLHDEVHERTVPPAAIPLLVDGGGGIFVLSAFHRSQLPAHALPHAQLTSNGLEAASIANGPNHNDRFLYASTPSAGLELLLAMWPQIRARLPTARLDVYYGFWPAAMWNEQPHLLQLKKQLEPLLKQEGVHYHGMRSEAELAWACAEAGFYAYPTDKAETSGIALMKAQACGCIPITSGLTASALPETCADEGNFYDLGPAGRPAGVCISSDPDWQRDFVRALLAAATRPPAELATLRERMKDSARRRFSWASVARQWTQIFHNETAPLPPAPPPQP